MTPTSALRLVESRSTSLAFPLTAMTSRHLDAIRHVITKCADSVFEMEGSCIKTTLQYEVLQALSYYHAGDPVIENELSAAFNAAAYRNDTATVRAYFDRVYEWMYRNYRVKPEKTPPVLFFQQPCIR